jgi:hypothetical protein
MNKAFDHNGTLVSTSRPVKQLRTVKKTLLIDSADRDATKYYTNGDVVYFLPRVYENVVSIRLKSATFTPVAAQPTSPPTNAATIMLHRYENGQNIPTARWSSDTAPTKAVNYILLDIEGLNKCDETSFEAQRSTLVDNYFARIPFEVTSNNSVNIINYNDHTYEENVSRYTPAISKLDRLHIVTRLHTQQKNTDSTIDYARGFLYWTTDGAFAAGNNRAAEYSLVFELEMLENGFDEFSSFETRIHNRDIGNYGC